MFQNSDYCLLELIDNCLGYVESYLHVKNYHMLMYKEKLFYWKAPPRDKVKLNFDEILFHSLVLTGIGVILRGGQRVPVTRCSALFAPPPHMRGGHPHRNGGVWGTPRIWDAPSGGEGRIRRNPDPIFPRSAPLYIYNINI